MTDELCESENQTLDKKQVNRAIAYGSRLLAAREYSAKNMAEKMRSKKYQPDEIEAAIDMLKENNWLSDQRFCESFLRSKVNQGLGKQRIVYELTSKGISQSMIQNSMNELEVDWLEMCLQTASRKVASSGLTNDLKDKQKLYRFLQYRGFSGEHIRTALKQHFND
ncbi:MAG: recombination regulator RecX [Gammaproteobacteria bacterium]|nr:recombination regulator RecX [Gammaproteobacteria bacterium]MDH5630389.1 recombination regulator RecX [Gammaproteobacteria bacterium]